MNVALLALAATLPTFGVMALDVEDPGLDALLRAVSFSPWGAVIVYVFWSTKRGMIEVLDRLAALWKESILVARAWVQATEDLVESIRVREGQPQDPYRKPARPPRPRTNPVNLPNGDDRER